MTSELELASAARKAADLRWKQAIVAAHVGGATYRDIAAHAGVSYQRVAQIVASLHR